MPGPASWVKKEPGPTITAIPVTFVEYWEVSTGGVAGLERPGELLGFEANAEKLGAGHLS